MLEAQSRGRFQIGARAVVTLNDHPAEVMIDPRVDLAAVPDGAFARADWILPLG